MNPLDQLRAEIDQIDQELVALVNRRGELARQVGERKANAGDPVYSQAREEQVIERSLANNRGPLSNEAIRVIIREVISGCRALQRSFRVAYLGPEFSYSHLAAIHQFGQSTELIPVATIAAAFGASHLELRHHRRQFDALPARQHKLRLVRSLPASVEELWSRTDRKVRNQVRKAQQAGLTAHAGGRSWPLRETEPICRAKSTCAVPSAASRRSR